MTLEGMSSPSGHHIFHFGEIVSQLGERDPIVVMALLASNNAALLRVFVQGNWRMATRDKSMFSGYLLVACTTLSADETMGDTCAITVGALSADNDFCTWGKDLTLAW